VAASTLDIFALIDAAMSRSKAPPLAQDNRRV
jgi:hypothetical protein